jgi:hypothetical protein
MAAKKGYKRRSSTWDRRTQTADDKQIRQRTRIEELFSLRHIPPTKQCPITSGRPTQMTADQFERMCQHNQAQVDRRVGPFTAPASRVSWCAVCQGQLRPKELRLVSERTLRDRRERELKEIQKKARTGATVQAYWEQQSQAQQGGSR